MIGTSSVPPRKSSEQFWKISGNLRKVVRNGRKISKTSSLVCLCIINRILHARLWIWFSSSHVQFDQHLTALTLEISSEHSKIKFISMRRHVISSIYVTITLEEIVIVMIIFQIVPEKHLRRRIYEYSFSKSLPISASIFYQMILIKQECNPTGMNSREICKDTKVFFPLFQSQISLQS